MDSGLSGIRNNIDQWIQHFKSVIEGQLLPEEQRGIFLLKNNSSKNENKGSQQKEISVTLVSPVARDIDSAKSELTDQKQHKHSTDTDPISHFPETFSSERNHISSSASKKRKRPYKKRSESASKSKKNKVSTWNKY
jgi:hypothetical protein